MKLCGLQHELQNKLEFSDRIACRILIYDFKLNIKVTHNKISEPARLYINVCISNGKFISTEVKFGFERHI